MNSRLQFSDLSLSKEIAKAIEDMGFEEPTPIQALAIPLIQAGRDVTAQAQTGTGKTSAFGIPVIENIDASQRVVQAIVLCPTRELAIQIAEEFSHLLAHLPKISVLPVYGGQPIERQLKALANGVHIVIGTPGRVMDHLKRRTLSLDNVSMVVLDEADQMLDMGFRDDIELILKRIPQKRQTLLFSATLPKPIIEISKRFQNRPEFVRVEYQEVTVPAIEQSYIEVRDRDKLESLCRVIDVFDPQLAIIFSNTKRGAEDLAGRVRARGYRAEELHGDMKQSQRDRVMGGFRKGTLDILIATDVAARGIDVEDVDLVINYDVPQDVDYYVHRIGRTGRAGKSGRAITFVTPRDFTKLREIQKYIKVQIPRKPLPTADDVMESKTHAIIDVVRTTVQNGGIEPYARIVQQESEGDLTTLEIAAALLKMRMEQGADTHKERTAPVDFGDTGAEAGMVRFFIGLGRDHSVAPKDIVGAIAGETGIPGKSIGAIRILDTYSFVEVPRDCAEEVYTIMKERTIRGQPTGIEPAQGRRD
ncbi:DEAD/DEAH box helicase [Methanoregula sp.]|uniref:DEAD/DEAH box helicase n=1 Tax=Methanoregula sp. TaxID=2052170 RepID=UPI002CEF995B|nr:DEAD/DEAH box helicase [Methanoregula sp.]HVP96214.1 DEAD/DEAH box helicase [Methanoregula sp.]